MQKTINLPKWTELLVVLYNTPPKHRYSGKLHRKTRMTTRHIRNLTAILEEMHFIEQRRERKIKYITLTESGERLAELFLRIYPKLKR